MIQGKIKNAKCESIELLYLSQWKNAYMIRAGKLKKHPMTKQTNNTSFAFVSGRLLNIANAIPINGKIQAHSRNAPAALLANVGCEKA